MDASRRPSQLLVALAAVGLCLPAAPTAASDGVVGSVPVAAQSLPVRDVELAPGGLLIGRMIDANGKPMAGEIVNVIAGAEAIATTQTDRDGVFAVTGLRGGVHQIASDDAVQLCRLWAPGMAPPRAARSLEVVSPSGVVRGQWGPPPGNRMLKRVTVLASNPFVVGGVIVAAVAIPIALSDDDGPNS